MSEELVTVAAFTSAVEAQNCRAALEDQGIQVVLADENLVSVDWLYSVGVGGVKLRVPAPEAERARQALRAARQVPVQCPACGSLRTGRELPPRWLYPALLLTLFFGLPFVPFWMRRWRCAGCGARWKSRYAEEPGPAGAERPAPEVAPPGALISVVAPWRHLDWTLRLAYLIAAVALVRALDLGPWALLAAPAAGLAVLALGAFFSWRWEQVTLTRDALVIDDPDGRRVFPIPALTPGELPGGAPAVLGPEGPILAARGQGREARDAVLLKDQDLEAILGLLRQPLR
ncbi:MAG TPA: LITAF-like zinc ribbon domain-containing protein [Candidatus Saccharimonadales bacterium]|nr:LITAF-like zinc ribbon domain-containing protein [Candidatus Saccharimonadales bacterium]